MSEEMRDRADALVLEGQFLRALAEIHGMIGFDVGHVEFVNMDPKTRKVAGEVYEKLVYILMIDDAAALLEVLKEVGAFFDLVETEATAMRPEAEEIARKVRAAIVGATPEEVKEP